MTINVFANYPKPDNYICKKMKEMKACCRMDSIRESRKESEGNRFAVLTGETGEGDKRGYGFQSALDIFQKHLWEYWSQEDGLIGALRNAVKEWKQDVYRKNSDKYQYPYLNLAPGKLLAVAGREDEAGVVLWGSGQIVVVRDGTLEELSASREKLNWMEGFNDNNRLRVAIFRNPIPDAVILYTDQLTQPFFIKELYEEMRDLSARYSVLPRSEAEKCLNNRCREYSFGVGGYWITDRRQMSPKKNMDDVKASRVVSPASKRDVTTAKDVPSPYPVQNKSSAPVSPLFRNQGVSDATVYQSADQVKADLERKLQEARIALERTEKEYEAAVQEKKQVISRMTYLEEAHGRRKESLKEHRDYLNRKAALLQKPEEEGACP